LIWAHFVSETLFKRRLLSETRRKLFLQHNQLTRLPADLIESLKQLVLINLAYNDILWLDVGAFSSISLRHVDLSHNALRKLISMTFLYLPAAEMIDLSHNQVRILHPEKCDELEQSFLSLHEVLHNSGKINCFTNFGVQKIVNSPTLPE